MNITFNQQKITGFLYLLNILVFTACGPDKKDQKSQRPSFSTVKNIKYTEVRRSFTNGYAFSDQGYQLQPEWKLSFPSEDSVNIYNPDRRMFVNAPVLFDHDSIFNVAWAYLKLLKLSKDSLKFQVLKVNDQVISREKSVVFMTLYANDYIRNVLHQDPALVTSTNKADTLFIQRKAQSANTDTSKAFSATQPAQLVSKNNLLTISRQITTSADKTTPSPIADYLLPEYDITIHKAYDDFNYAFTVCVDQNGKMLFKNSIIYLYPEFEKPYKKIMRAIVDGYLKAYLNVTPGNTLGMPHASVVILHVQGFKAG